MCMYRGRVVQLCARLSHPLSFCFSCGSIICHRLLHPSQTYPQTSTTSGRGNQPPPYRSRAHTKYRINSVQMEKYSTGVKNTTLARETSKCSQKTRKRRLKIIASKPPKDSIISLALDIVSHTIASVTTIQSHKYHMTCQYTQKSIVQRSRGYMYIHSNRVILSNYFITLRLPHSQNPYNSLETLAQTISGIILYCILQYLPVGNHALG